MIVHADSMDGSEAGCGFGAGRNPLGNGGASQLTRTTEAFRLESSFRCRRRARPQVAAHVKTIRP